MNTISDRLRERASKIRARFPGYRAWASGETSDLSCSFACSDADFLEEIADDLEADERLVGEKYAETVDELEDKIRDLENENEKLKAESANLEWSANARG